MKLSNMHRLPCCRAALIYLSLIEWSAKCDGEQTCRYCREGKNSKEQIPDLMARHTTSGGGTEVYFKSNDFCDNASPLRSFSSDRIMHTRRVNMTLGGPEHGCDCGGNVVEDNLLHDWFDGRQR